MDTLIRTHRDLEVWQRAMDLVVEVYERTRSFPKDERFGLTAQIRSAAISIPCNVSEGAARGTTPEYRRFVSIARGSGAELDTLLQIAERVKITRSAELVRCKDLLEAIGKQLTSLHRKL